MPWNSEICNCETRYLSFQERSVSSGEPGELLRPTENRKPKTEGFK